MQIQLLEVTLARCIMSKIGYMLMKVSWLEQEATNQQKTLEEAFTRATKAKQKCLNSMEDIKRYHQTLIDMQEQYRRDVEAFVKVTQRNLSNMQLACILATFRAMQMEAEFIKMQVGYYEDGRFRLHGLTSWPKKFEMFLDSLLKMQENANIEWASHAKLEWEYEFFKRELL